MVLTLGFAGVEEGVVLCFGGDGHVAIEAAGLEGCAETGETAPRAASAIAIPVSSSHCGPCVDVALSASSAAERFAPAKRGGPAAAAIPIAALTPPIPHLRAGLSNQHSPRFISEKPHTVVIRC
jgi:hypothetical protein